MEGGLKLEADDNGGGTVTGPKLTYAGEGGGDPIAAEHFNELIFSTGLKVVKTEDCKFTITASGSGTPAKVGGTGCNDNSPCEDFTGCLTFGSGLKFTPADGGGTVAGPTVNREDVGGSFSKLIIGTGLKLEEGDNCEYTISSNLIQVGSLGCVTESCFDMTGCLTFSGFDFNKAENGGANVKAPMVSGEFFKNIQLGEGLKYKQLGTCEYELSAISGNNSGIKVGSTGCYDVACARIGSDDCLVFEGLKFDGTNTVLGPYIAEDESGGGNIFSKIIAGSGLKLEEKSDCVYEINAEAGSGLNIAIDTCHKTNNQGCNPGISIGGDECLTIGGGLYFNTAEKILSGPKFQGHDFANITVDQSNGLKVEDDSVGGDCSYLISWTGGMTEATGIKVGAVSCEGTVGEIVLVDGGLFFGGGLTMGSVPGGANPDGKMIKQGTISQGEVGGAWESITIGDGLELKKGGTLADDNCNLELVNAYKSGIKIQGRGCGGVIPCHVMSGCLIFDGGLSVADEGDNRIIKAPMVNGNHYRNLKFIGDGQSSVTETYDSIEGCQIVIDIPGGGGGGGSGITKIAKDGCGYGEQSCTPISGCLTFGDGLSLTSFSSTAATVKGPKFGGSAFKDVALGEGIKYTADSETCIPTISVTGFCKEADCEQLTADIAETGKKNKECCDKNTEDIAETGKKNKECCDNNTTSITTLTNSVSTNTTNITKIYDNEIPGYTIPKFGSESCGGVQGTCESQECIYFGAGLTYAGSVVKGPTIEGGSVTAGHFGSLVIGDGLTLEEGGPSECTYTIKADAASNPEWFYIGCDGSANVDMGIPTTIKVGYGLRATHFVDDVVQIEGPTIKSSTFGNLKPDSTNIVTLTEASTCDWEIGIDCAKLISACDLGQGGGANWFYIGCDGSANVDMGTPTTVKVGYGLSATHYVDDVVQIEGPSFAGSAMSSLVVETDSEGILESSNDDCAGKIELNIENLKAYIRTVIEEWCGEEGDKGNCGGNGGGGGGSCNGTNKTLTVVTNVCCQDSSFTLTFTKMVFVNGCLTDTVGNPDPPSC